MTFVCLGSDESELQVNSASMFIRSYAHTMQAVRISVVGLQKNHIAIDACKHQWV